MRVDNGEIVGNEYMKENQKYVNGIDITYDQFNITTPMNIFETTNPLFYQFTDDRWGYSKLSKLTETRQFSA